MPAKSPLPLVARFWTFVDTTPTCWLWTGYVNEFGYGKFSYREPGGKRHCVRAHRFAWEAAHGDSVPDGQWVLHRCDVKLCVRPDHLHLGDRPTNVREAMERHRIASGARHWTSAHPEKRTVGERVHSARLTAAQVIEIRRRYAQGGLRHRDLADEYGMTRRAIGDIIQRRNWAHL